MIEYTLRKLKTNCHSKIYYQLKIGKIIKPICCQRCKAKKILEAHHPDYKKPLEILWICRRCHAKLHPSEKGYMDSKKCEI
jgi:hypothetical protein